MRADLATRALTPAHDRLLDILAEHLVTEFLAEVEATSTDDDVLPLPFTTVTT